MRQKKTPEPKNDLRSQAEEQVKHEPAMTTPTDEADALAMVHELQVHQIELQLQNQELRQANRQIEELLEKYSDLYNFASVGYLTLTVDGKIIDVNLTGASLLGLNRSELQNKPIWSRVAGPSHAGLKAFLQSLAGTSEHQTTEAILLGKKPQSFHALIDGVRVEDAISHETLCRMSITNITPLKEAQSALQAAYDEMEQRVLDRTRELWNANQALASAKQEAEVRADHDHRIAETLQMALVPYQRDFRVQDCHVAVRYEAAAEEAEIGGDFFDVFKMGGDTLGIVVGDVVGKGLKAAAHAVAARHVIRSYAYLDTSPAVVMTLANRAICLGELSDEEMLTAALFVVDMNSKTWTYTNCGHEPLVLRDAEGTVTELIGYGAALGIDPDYIYAEQSFTYKPGDWIIAVTDGITEARHGGQLLGQEGFMEFIAANPGLCPSELVDGILQTAVSFANGKLQDDAIVLALSCC